MMVREQRIFCLFENRFAGIGCMKENNQVQHWKVLLAFAAIYLVWGSTFLAALIGLNGIPPYFMISMRFLIAGLMLFTWAKIRKQPNPDWATVRSHGLSGILMLVGGTGSVVWSEQYLPSGVAAIIVAALPIWFILFDRPQWKSNFSSGLTLAGIVVGFSGILLLFGKGKAGVIPLEKQHMQSFSIALLMAGTVSWAIGSLYSKKIFSDSSTLMTVSMQLMAAGVFAFLISTLLGEWRSFTWAQVSSKAWIALWYMIILGSVITYLAYIWLLTIRPAVQVGTYAYVNPVVAVLLGWGYAGEQVNGRHLVSLLAVISGVLLINLPKYKSVTHA